MTRFPAISLALALGFHATMALAQSPSSSSAAQPPGPASSGPPSSTGGTHTPGTSASGEKAKCPAAIARSQARSGGSPHKGPTMRSDVGNMDDCPSVGSSQATGDNPSRSDSATAGPGSRGTSAPAGGTSK